MKRLMQWGLPLLLGVAGIVLIIVGTDRGGEPARSLPPISQPSSSPQPDASEVAQASPTPSLAGSPTETATPVPTPTPLPDSVVAAQLGIPSVGVNVEVRQSSNDETDNFPTRDAAYILQGSSQPGRNNNSYIFAHANETLFKPLWNVHLGAQVLVEMSDGSVLTYVVTEVRPNVPCPDPEADPANNPADPPLALQLHDNCDEGLFWIQPTEYERLTLQTSQGFNRNWGEFIVIAEPAG